MDEKTKEILLAQVLRKKAFRDNRRQTRPSGVDVVRLMLLASESIPYAVEDANTGECRPA